MRPAYLGRHTLWLPLVVMAVCTAIPEPGRIALDALGPTAFCVVFFGVLCLAPGKITRTETATTIANVVAVSVLAPVITYTLAILLRVAPDIRALMVIAACAPIAQVAGALAVTLKLPARAAAIAALLTAVTNMVVLPLNGHFLAHGGLPISIPILALRCATLVMAPAILAFTVRQIFPAHVEAWRADFRGLLVIGLSLFAAARGPALRYGLTSPALLIYLTLLASVVMASAMLAGWLLARPFGRDTARASAFAVGMRNVPMAWAAIGNTLSVEGSLFMTMTAVPFYLLPVLMRLFLRVNRQKADGFAGSNVRYEPATE